jgi:hypothetical protein
MIFAGAVLFSSCARDELFEREQYKKVFSLLSDYEGFNVFSEVHALDSTVSQGYVVASCGGTLPTEEDIEVSLVEDQNLLDEYNKNRHDVDESRYFNWLPRDHYEIEKYSITVPTGERTGRMSVKVHPNGLSPDSVYLIPMRVNDFSSYEVDHTKSTVLYHVYLKNYYATSNALTNKHTLYNARIRVDTNILVMKDKEIFPLSANSVRSTAGELGYAADVSIINTNSIVLTVDTTTKKVTISPWKDNNLQLEQIDGDPDYPNTFYIYDDGYDKTYKTFLLRYNYRFSGKNYIIQEELRLEFKEELKY